LVDRVSFDAVPDGIERMLDTRYSNRTGQARGSAAWIARFWPDRICQALPFCGPSWPRRGQTSSV